MRADWRLVGVLALAAACKGPPEQRHPMPGANPDRGRSIIEQAGCGACHAIPGVWPRGSVGPDLSSFANQGLIAGQLPNRPDVLANFLRNAPALIPDATMPAMPISESEARDAAAYLYTLDHE